MSIPAGGLVWRARYERRAAPVDDGYGNVEGGWEEVATLATGFRAAHGRERLEAGRLESTIEGVAPVHAGPTARSLRAEDRIIFLAGPYAGMAMQIRAVTPRPDAASIEFVCEGGVAT
mgnify:FL=1